MIHIGVQMGLNWKTKSKHPELWGSLNLDPDLNFTTWGPSHLYCQPKHTQTQERKRKYCCLAVLNTMSYPMAHLNIFQRPK